MINKEQAKKTLVDVLKNMIENDTDNMEFILSNNDLEIDFIFEIKLKKIKRKI